LQYSERLKDSLPRVIDRIRSAETQSGRGSESVRLIAVTKGHPHEAVQAAISAGLADLGENRAEELVTKSAAFLEERTRWHLIGHIQSRKARLAARHADLVHSVDSLKLARKLSFQAAQIEKTLPILVQVNVSGEATKGGFSLGEALDSVLEIATLSGLELQGLMTMAPFGAESRVLSRTFGGLRRVLDEARSLGRGIGKELSMGMTQDLEVAIQEGSSMVRVGTALFGPRATSGRN